MIIQLLRTQYTDTSTVGYIDLAGWTFYTIEQPWRDNEQGHSCVPVGTYTLIPYVSPRHGATYCLHNPLLNIYGTGTIPPGGRSYCEIHSANWASQLNGCIALGSDDVPMFNPATGKVELAVEDSRNAVAKFLSIIGIDRIDHQLAIGDKK